MTGCPFEQEDSFEDILDLDDDLELDVDLNMSQDIGIEVVGGDITEIIISDDVSEVRCHSRPRCSTKHSA